MLEYALELVTMRLCSSAPYSGMHNPLGRAMQDLFLYKINCKCKSADATQFARPGRIHAASAAARVTR
jgi:hypothetical protein